ncbi:MAG: adenylate/guanylate cyclase domain-containing protein [Bacteroidetes bacterium]|nr:adenylate/guanylate cyclase domain-containing protein [Bacteroidota bacterium]
MNNTFQHRLNEELLRSERRRALILVVIFLIAMCFRSIDYLLSKDDQTMMPKTFSGIWLFPITVILFELISYLYMSKLIKRKKIQIPTYKRYLNTAIEISLPSVVIMVVAKQYPSFDILQSPAVMIYFIFIILSTLRLDFTLSLFCGALACCSYVLISIFIYNHFTSIDAARVFILFFSGIASGLVAKQIRGSINNSLKEAEKRQKVENLFGQQISMEVAEKILENDGKIESKRMNVAIMFIDIRNFTNFAAGKNPEEIVDYQNAFFKIVLDTVTKHSGIVHQFLGDGCMVTFGAPIDLKNPSQNAVFASIMLLKSLQDAVKEGEIEETKIGIGIHTGEVVTGNIGSAERQQYSITGSVVILASRIEQLNKQFGSQLLVSEDVMQCIQDADLPVTSFGSVALKGWHKPISIYKLV